QAQQNDAEEVREALAALAQIEEAIVEAPARDARRLIERLVTKITVVFDHDRPRNVTHASHVDLEFHPDVQKLLPSSSSMPSTTSGSARSVRSARGRSSAPGCAPAGSSRTGAAATSPGRC